MFGVIHPGRGHTSRQSPMPEPEFCRNFFESTIASSIHHLLDDRSSRNSSWPDLRSLFLDSTLYSQRVDPSNSSALARRWERPVVSSRQAQERYSMPERAAVETHHPDMPSLRSSP